MGLVGDLVKDVAEQKVARAAGTAAIMVAAGVAGTIEAASDFVDKHPLSKKKTDMVRVPKGSEEYAGMFWGDVKTELQAYGFTNIAVLPQKDLINGWITKDGSVSNVTIGTKNSFHSGAKFHMEDRVVITYHTFKYR